LANTNSLSASTLPRRSGIRLDAAKLDHEIGRRGITARVLAAASGVPEVTISRARHGRPVTEGTLRRLTSGLLGIPLLNGGDLLIAAPENEKTANGSRSSAVSAKEASTSGTSQT
jgi:transcriptional regulator with XRE-family HTH domain